MHEEDASLAISDVMTLGEQVGRSLGREKVLAKIAGLFAAVSLLLALMGLYGVTNYVVARRRSEIGIRMACGARPQEVLYEILRQSMRMVLVGCLVGGLAALLCGRVVSNQLYGVTASDPFLIAAVTVLLFVTALIATFFPALRAAQTDPAIVLRMD